MLLRGVDPRELLARGACSGRSGGPGGADAQGTAILCPSLPDTGQALSPSPLPQVQTIETPVPILRAPASDAGSPSPANQRPLALKTGLQEGAEEGLPKPAEKINPN